MPSALEMSGTTARPRSLAVYWTMSMSARARVLDSCACRFSRSSSLVGWRSVVWICQISHGISSYIPVRPRQMDVRGQRQKRNERNQQKPYLAGIKPPGTLGALLGKDELDGAEAAGLLEGGEGAEKGIDGAVDDALGGGIADGGEGDVEDVEGHGCDDAEEAVEEDGVDECAEGLARGLPIDCLHSTKPRR